MISPDDELFGAIEAEISKERGPRATLRSASTRTRSAVAMAAAGAIPLVIWLTWARSDLSVYPAWRLIAELVSLGGLVVLAVWIALRPLQARPLPRGVRIGAVVLTVAVVALLAVLPAAYHAAPASLDGQGFSLAPRASACFAFGVIVGVPLLALLWSLSRRSRLVAAAYAVPGVVGVIALQLHCPSVGAEHLAAGHVTVLLGFLLGAVIAAALRR